MLALGLALSASMAWGGSDLVAGLAGRRLPLLTVLIGAQASGLALVIALLVAVGGHGPSAQSALLAAGAGLAELLGYAALYKSLALGPMSVVAPISSIAAIVPVSAAVAGGQPIGTTAAVGFGLALTGAGAACAERGAASARAPGGSCQAPRWPPSPPCASAPSSWRSTRPPSSPVRPGQL